MITSHRGSLEFNVVRYTNTLRTGWRTVLYHLKSLQEQGTEALKSKSLSILTELHVFS
jgi:hypothetical protein